MFRDESQNQSARHQRLKNAESSRANDLLSSAATDATLIVTNIQVTHPQIQFQPESLLSASLGNSAEDQATCFFFQNYVLKGNEFSRGQYDYLSDIYGSEEVGSGLADTVTSLGMVGLANFWRAPNIMATAHAKYHSALRTVSAQLRDVDQAKSDQTLISIMLLGLYEVQFPCIPQLGISMLIQSRLTHATVASPWKLGRNTSAELPLSFNFVVKNSSERLLDTTSSLILGPKW
jgi:hypothetical protein